MVGLLKKILIILFSLILLISAVSCRLDKTEATFPELSQTMTEDSVPETTVMETEDEQEQGIFTESSLENTENIIDSSMLPLVAEGMIIRKNNDGQEFLIDTGKVGDEDGIHDNLLWEWYEEDQMWIHCSPETEIFIDGKSAEALDLKDGHYVSIYAYTDDVLEDIPRFCSNVLRVNVSGYEPLPPNPQEENPVNYDWVEGIIRTINYENRMIHLIDDNTEWSVSYDSETTVTKDTQSITVEDLTAGQEILVFYDTEQDQSQNTTLAWRILVENPEFTEKYQIMEGKVASLKSHQDSLLLKPSEWDSEDSKHFEEWILCDDSTLTYRNGRRENFRNIKSNNGNEARFVYTEGENPGEYRMICWIQLTNQWDFTEELSEDEE